MSSKGNRMYRQNQQSWQRKQWNQGGSSSIPPLMGFSSMSGNSMNMSNMQRMNMNNQNMSFQNMSSGMNNYSNSDLMNMQFSSNQQNMGMLGGSMNKMNLFGNNSQSSLLGNFNPLMANMSSQMNKNDFFPNSNKRMRMDQGRNWGRQSIRSGASNRGRRDFNIRNKSTRSRSSSNDRDSPVRGRNWSRKTDSEKDDSEEDSKDIEHDKYDPASPTEDIPAESDADGGQSFLCHACNVPCGNQEKFFKHLQSKSHQMIMDAIGRQYDQTAKQMEARLKAEEHLRKIEKRGGKDMWGSGKVNYCTICQVRFSDTLINHRRTKEHKRQREHLYPECRKCRIKNFPNRAVYEAHCRSDLHLKNCEEWHKRRSSSYGSQDEDDSQFDPNEFVTVDATGIFEDELSESREYDDDDDQILDSEELRSFHLTFPEFNPEIPVGQDVVIAVTGFFCRLCHKFYKEENSAKFNHCQTHTHYDNYKAFKLAKQRKLARNEAKKLKRETGLEGESFDKESTENKEQTSENCQVELSHPCNPDNEEGAATDGNDNNNILDVHSLNPTEQQTLSFEEPDNSNTFENLENLSFPNDNLEQESTLEHLAEDIIE